MTAVLERVVERPIDDDYSTPLCATRALVDVEPLPGIVWEPFAGRGYIVKALRECGVKVRATTLYPQDNPVVDDIFTGVDFLSMTRPWAGQIIVSNPPYGRLYGAKDRKAATKCVEHALGLQPAKLCLLLNLKFIASRGRKEGIFSHLPPARIHVFADRVTMYPGNFTGKRGVTTECHAWFVWTFPYRNFPPQIYWLDSRPYQREGDPS